MALKLIDENWIEEKIKLIEKLNEDLIRDWKGTTRDNFNSGAHSGSLSILKLIKTELKSLDNETNDNR